MFINQSMANGLSIDQKIAAMKKNPEDPNLLYDALSHLVSIMDENFDPKSIHDMDVVMYVLAAALKSDIIHSKAYALVISFIDQLKVPPIYHQYIIMRVMQKMPDMTLEEIALSVNLTDSLPEEDKR
mmetsp:Transcript_8608/g.14548  ORF Transcript_8608/g.14548 Transcript_8608/m.14548 type:complete len:127 (-) Transcript_8608:938-1318(-)